MTPSQEHFTINIYTWWTIMSISIIMFNRKGFLETPAGSSTWPPASETKLSPLHPDPHLGTWCKLNHNKSLESKLIINQGLQRTAYGNTQHEGTKISEIKKITKYSKPCHSGSCSTYTTEIAYFVSRNLSMQCSGRKQCKAGFSPVCRETKQFLIENFFFFNSDS